MEDYFSMKYFKDRVDDFFKWVKGTELVIIEEIDVNEDPIRPHLDLNFRVSHGRQIFGLEYDGNIEGIVCIALTNEIPHTEKELELMNGFRRANVQWSKFKSDFKIEKLDSNEKREEFLKILKPFLEKMSMKVDWEVIEGTNDEDLINTISMCCPFDVNEKQALLEAISLEKRREVLTSLIHINLNKNNMGSRYVS